MAQSFNDADIIDILLFATPKKWQHEMDRMGFDPLASSPEELLAFMENCEAVEDYDTTSTAMARKPNNSKNGNTKGAKASDPKKQKWCDNHGWSNHTMAECNQNKPGFNSFKKGNNKPKEKAFGNKTNAKSWQHKANDSTKEANKKEMNAFMKKQIRQTIRQEVNAYDKKKGDSDLNMLEIVLKDFNCADMDDMVIDSDHGTTPKRGRTIDEDLEFDSEGEVSV